MADRPYTVLSCAISLDGYLDDATGQRLVLSSPADLDRVDALRADSDAVLVGAGTVRADNPRLLVRSPSRRARRVATGRTPTPDKVTVTRDGQLDPTAAFFTAGNGRKLVYCPSPSAARTRDLLGAVATVVDVGPVPVMMCAVAEDLAARGVRRLLVEGGQAVHTQFLRSQIADELHVVVAPLFVGDSRAPRVVRDGPLPWNRDRRAELADVRRLGDVVLLRYALSERFGQHPASDQTHDRAREVVS
jgi:5-amino-6-(5-phosphoribosylamino)uracil reductase